MAPEIGSGEMSPREPTPIQKREQRVHSYMMRFNGTPKDNVKNEFNQLIIRGSEFPSAQYKLAREINNVLDNRKLVADEKIVVEYGEKLESRKEAEDAMVALLYDIQVPLHGRNMHVDPPELPKLLKILEDTRERRSSGYIFDETMVNSKDQAVLFLTQAYFYGIDRLNGKKVIYIEDVSSDEVEIEKLVPKLNTFLSEKDQFTLIHRKTAIPGITYFDPKYLFSDIEPKKQQTETPVKEKKDSPSPIKTAAEKKRAEEIEGTLNRSKRRLDFDLNNPDRPFNLNMAPPFEEERGSIGETFGSEGKENIPLFSLLSMTSPKAGERIVNWLISEKRTTKRKVKIQGIVTLSEQLFREVLAPETKKEFDAAFAEDIATEDVNLARLHKAIMKRAPQRSKEDVGADNMEALVVEAAEKLFLMKQAHVLGDEVKREILARREATLGGTPIDAEGKSTTKDIEEVLKRIEAQIGHPVDQSTPIKPYEMNVYFPPISSIESYDPYDSSVPVLMTKMMNGERIDGKLFQLNQETLCGYVVSLCIEKWSHQARSVEALRQKMPSSEVENAGHYMPYKVEDVKDERGYSEKVQTYFIHDNTPDSTDPNKGCLYIDSQTHLSVPVLFEKPKKEGENMRIEYVYGLNGSIPGIRGERVIT